MKFDKVSNVATLIIITGCFLLIMLTTTYSAMQHQCECMSIEDIDSRFYAMLEEYFYSQAELESMTLSGHGFYTEATHPCFRGYNNPWGCLLVFLPESDPYDAFCTVCGEKIYDIDAVNFEIDYER